MDPDMNRNQKREEERRKRIAVQQRENDEATKQIITEREVMEEVRPTERGFVDDPQDSVDSDSSND